MNFFTKKEHDPFVLERVREARRIIKSGLFTDEEITKICQWLGFCDTAFRDKTQTQKLGDYLLDISYWKNKKERRKEKVMSDFDMLLIQRLNKKIEKLEAEIDRLTARAEKAEAEVKKYKAFWEWSRQADKMTFETYDYKED